MQSLLAVRIKDQKPCNVLPLRAIIESKFKTKETKLTTSHMQNTGSSVKIDIL